MVQPNTKVEVVEVSDEGHFEVAIIGGGIIGLALATGLLQRNIRFTIYERAHTFREVGAGIGFTPNAERAMTALNPALHAAFRKVAAQNDEDYFYYLDGYHSSKEDPKFEETILKLYLGERGFEGCRRSDYLAEMVKLVPSEYIQHDKDLVSVIENDEDERIHLSFRDGTTATADIVIGCDGIHSKMREIILGDNHPACTPSYSHKYAIRSLVPMDKARAALGVFKTSNRVMHCGPGAHALTFPVANNTILNVVAFVTDPDEWTAPDNKFVVPATKAEATEAFSKFNPVVQDLMALLPENLDKWAVFDTCKEPVPSYVNGRLCLAGDAAHASSPHHGAGAGCGIEDCLALAILLQQVSEYPKTLRPTAARVALEVYNNVRYDRSQWIMDTSRVIGEIYEYQNPECLSNHKKIAQEIHDRSHKIWDYDINAMVDDSCNQFTMAMKEVPSSAGSKTTSELDKPLVADPPAPSYLSGFRLWAFLISMTLVYFLMMLDMSILSTAIPHITDEFNSLLDVGWYGAAYQLCAASFQPLTGKMYARFNSKKIFLGFFTIFNIGSAICGAAQTSAMLIAGRFIAGLGGAGLMNGGFTMIHASIPPERRPGMLGFFMAFGNLGSASGPLIGGAITEFVSWRWCFYINLPAGALVFAALLFLNVPEILVKPHWKEVLKHPMREFDLIGFGLFGPAAIMFFIVLDFGGNRYAWDSQEVIGLFCGTGVMFAIFCFWNYRKGMSALIPFSMLGKRIVWSCCSTIFIISGTVFVTAYYLPLYFQGVKADTPFESGYNFLPTIMTQIVFTIVSGKLVQRFGYYLPFILVGGALNSIGSGLFTTVSTSTSVAKLVGYQLISGTGRGLALPMPMIALQSSLLPTEVPVALAIFVFSQQIGGALMTVIGQTIFTNELKNNLKSDLPTVDSKKIIEAGVTRMRGLVNAGELPSLLRAYSDSIGTTFYFGTGMSILGVVVSCWMGWKDVRPKPKAS
ncbi:hypothetical protein COCCADRAFT_110947 [Bipolaris zeicola 26-R-13]|uniref:Major facilitator superfamily (MFS) profile domain-containing protein n=1 Tax=Cochliobolus carbonum (strain 26-R-13) TaxID=930089 RepID=W6XKJ4_COCC2|nr:uncharacterized protein COCCADRAFT_110947 [Bipolaris zeicola 26-R-13]EUC27722.1 hypothetical protein COCCADRAFT_110947 [Bipolaris zeicola 26-R-13]